MRFHRAVVSVHLGALAATIGCSARPLEQSLPVRPQSPAHAFVSEDVVRFMGAFELLPQVSDTATFLDTTYIAHGSAGLKAYAARYSMSGRGLAAAIARYPADYAGIGARLRWLDAHLDSLGRVLDRYRSFYPAMVDLPVYFLVGEHQGINSGSEAGPLHTIENGAATPARANLSAFLAHEVTHIQQFSAVGLARYRTLYTTRPSLLGIVVREGIAEFVAELVTGSVTQRQAQAYFAAHEDDVWREFRGSICATEPGEWAGRRPSDPARPSFLGYALGASIARAYYASAREKAAALRVFLTSDAYATILLDSGYAETRGETRESLRQALVSCKS